MDKARWANVCTARRDYQTRAGTVVGRPLEAFIEVSARCNLRCRMCPYCYDTRYRSSSGRPPLLTPELFARLRPLFPALLRAQLFGLGEPLLHPDLCDFIEELSTAGVEVWMTTNGTLVDTGRADGLARSGLDRVSVSIDGASEQTYQWIRRRASFDDLLCGLRCLVAARDRHRRPLVTVSFVAMACNLHELPAVVDLVAAHGIEELNVESLMRWPNSSAYLEFYGRQSPGVLGADRVHQIVSEASRRANDRGVKLRGQLADFDESSVGPVHPHESGPDLGTVCCEPWSTVAVTAAGEVRTCCLNNVTMGHLEGCRADDIWTGRRFAGFRRQHATNGACPTGCGPCLRENRKRISPFFVAVEASSQRPWSEVVSEPEARDGWVIESPRDGETVTDPLVVTGCTPLFHRSRIRRIGRRSWPHVCIDNTTVASLTDRELQGGRFEVIVPVPFLTEGEHVLSLARSGDSAPGQSRRSISFWRPLQHEARGLSSAI